MTQNTAHPRHRGTEAQKDEGMKDEGDSQQTMSRELTQPKEPPGQPSVQMLEFRWKSLI